MCVGVGMCVGAVKWVGAGRPLRGRLLGVRGEVVDCFRNKRFLLLKEY